MKGRELQMKISFIFAMDEARGIGKDNKMPWYLPADFAYFKRMTLEHTILMGRKTFDSIGRKPLPKRHNVIMTRDENFSAEGCDIVHSVEEALERFGSGGSWEGKELFVIGGVEVFRMFMPYVDRMYITEIAHKFEVDIYFPLILDLEWQEVAREAGVKDEKNVYDHDYVVYERVPLVEHA
jgi:dihydrofolate reductase